MKIKFYAHASFRLETDDLAIVTDPYTPAPGNSGFDPIDEKADIVLMSSDTDSFHSDPSHVLGNPIVVNTLALPTEGKKIDNKLFVKSYPAWESMTFDYRKEYNLILMPTRSIILSWTESAFCTWATSVFPFSKTI